MTTSTSKSKNKSDTIGTFVTTLTAVIAGIKANLPSNKTITYGNESTTGTAIAASFQAYVDKASAATTAQSGAKTAVAARAALEKPTRAELKQFTTWAVGQYGAAAYSMFGLPEPKPRTTNPTNKAIGIEKQKATRQKQKAALASIAPPQETLVAYDANGNAIGPNAPSAASANAAPAAAAGAAPAGKQ